MIVALRTLSDALDLPVLGVVEGIRPVRRAAWVPPSLVVTELRLVVDAALVVRTTFNKTTVAVWFPALDRESVIASGRVADVVVRMHEVAHDPRDIVAWLSTQRAA